MGALGCAHINLQILQRMGRPPTRPKPLRDGYYLEVRNKGSNTGVKIFRDTLEEMEDAMLTYRKSKDVIVLGESKNGEWVKDAAAKRKAKDKPAKAKTKAKAPAKAKAPVKAKAPAKAKPKLKATAKG